jgi:hypothetical protein
MRKKTCAASCGPKEEKNINQENPKSTEGTENATNQENIKYKILNIKYLLMLNIHPL